MPTTLFFMCMLIPSFRRVLVLKVNSRKSLRLLLQLQLASSDDDVFLVSDSLACFAARLDSKTMGVNRDCRETIMTQYRT